MSTILDKHKNSRSVLRVLPRLLVWFVGLPLFGSPVWVTMDFVLNSPATPRGFYHFLMNGLPVDLLCDDALRPLNDTWQGLEVSLNDDLSSSVLGLQNDPQVLQKYQWIGLLDLRANEDPSMAPDIRDAIQYITDSTRPLTGTTSNLLSWVQAQHISDFNLSNFRIITSPDFQEQTGFIPEVPEPPPIGITALLLAALAGLKWRCAG
jgi:hypothetical protein